MTNFEWKILELYGDELVSEVKYLLIAKDDVNTVETEGYHCFSDGVVYKPMKETKEEDLIRWLDIDTTQDEVNIIKLNLQKQLEALKTSKKVSFPWEADTFTIG
jgi:hypothetical protein